MLTWTLLRAYYNNMSDSSHDDNKFWMRHLLALGDSILGDDVELNTQMLKTLKLALKLEVGEIALELIVVAFHALLSGLLLGPVLGFSQAVELVANAGARVVVELRVAVKERDVNEGHLC